MSGHITRMSRGSSVGSSASSPSSTSRSTSTCRAGPWQACTWTERSSLAHGSARGRTALAAMSDCSQPSRVSGGRRPGGSSSAARAAAGRAAARADRGRGWPAAGGRPAVAVVVAAGDGAGRVARARSTARRWGAAATGAGRGALPSAASSSISVTGSRVCPNSDSRCGQVERPTSRSGQRCWRAACAGVGAPPGRPARRHSSGCQARSSPGRPPSAVGARPSSQSASSCGRCTA